MDEGKGLFIIHLDKVWQSNLISGSLFFMSVNHIMMSCFYFLLAWSILSLLLLDDYLFMQSTLEIIAYWYSFFSVYIMYIVYSIKMYTLYI